MQSIMTGSTILSRIGLLGIGRLTAAALLLMAHLLDAYTLDLSLGESIMSVAADMAEDMMSFYMGDQPGQTPGLLPQPYYWWEAGALMGALIDYWYYTGDNTWNVITTQGLLFQVGLDRDYMPYNQTMTEGNDDQGFWGMAVLSAAEYNFPNPPPDQPQWLALAQAVFNTQASRWDESSCNGGLRWQIFRWNNGFDYKNSISQACFFNMAARLALYTRNETYASWADRIWDWMIGSQFMHADSYYIYDGAHIASNCTSITPYQWTYNAGAFLLGAAAMYNYTANGDQSAHALWRERVDGLLNGAQVFFIGDEKNIMSEVACESVHLCDLDQQSFKAYLARWMAATTKWAPWTYNTIKPLLDASATAAAHQCTGGNNGRMCGLMWANNSGKWDGTTGVGQQMAAMEVVLATMIDKLQAPVTGSTGGTSTGDPSAGSQDNETGSEGSQLAPDLILPVTTGDVAGAYLLTILAVVLLVAGIALALHDRFGECARKPESCKGMEPSGEQQCQGREWAIREKFRSGRTEQSMNLDGPHSPPVSGILRKVFTTPSVSIYNDQVASPSRTLSHTNDYPDEQPWRRPARQGDYAGAIDVHRGNGAGFGCGIIDLAGNEVDAEPPPSSSGAARWRGLWLDGSRDLTKLQKKPLPGKPGLGQQGRGPAGDDGKV